MTQDCVLKLKIDLRQKNVLILQFSYKMKEIYH